MTCEGQILGTAAYMSPEQAAGQGHWIDCRADVYSLGVIMFQLATGELPYRGNFEVQLASKLRDDAPDPRKLNRFVPRDFATICLKCLERDANRRYRDAGVLAAELRRFLQGEPIHARPLSRVARLWRWTKRRPALATAAALAALVMVAGPLAAIVIEAQRRELDGRVEELVKLVVGQQKETRLLREENANLQASLKTLHEGSPGVENVMLEWRRNLIAEIVRRHYDAALAALEDDALDLESQAQLQLGLGMMLAAVDRAADATAQLAGARAALEELVARAPNDGRLAAALADCCEQLAELYRDAGQAEAAQQAASNALEIRARLADRKPSDATAKIDLISSHYSLPPVAAALRAIPELSEGVIADWPRDAEAIYEAACRLTLKTPLLIKTPPQPTTAP
jgi:tetratricopeptide (TPR) repeat protein